MTALQATDNSIMEQENTSQLMNGIYAPDEAREIVNHLISTKVNYLKIQSFSQQVRFGTTNDAALKKVEVLQAAREDFNEMIMEAKRTGKTLRIKSSITVQVV